MNYQPLFDLMSQHGLTLLEGEMEEIVDVVNGMQQPKQKKLTLGQFSHIWESSERVVNIYSALLPYLADEQPEQFTALIDTKPDPSRLEVAERVLIAYISSPTFTGGSPKFLAEFAGIIADELIKQSKVGARINCKHPDEYYRKNEDGDEWCDLCKNEI